MIICGYKITDFSEITLLYIVFYDKLGGNIVEILKMERYLRQMRRVKDSL